MVVVLTAVVVRVIVVVVMMIVTGMIVPVAVGMGVFVGMTVPAMIVFMSVRVLVSVVVAMRPVHVELHAFDGGLARAVDVQVPVLTERELAQFRFKFPGIHAEVDHRAEEHVAADAAEDVEVKGFHGAKK
jgi:hypothetical protein